jgi:leucyl/phenylalanyl-tRNA---protein transferase
MNVRFGPEELLACYRRGVFPMGEARDRNELFLCDPEKRGIIPLDGFHLPARLRRTIRQAPFEIRIDSAFAAVLDGCARARDGREETWINSAIRTLYTSLFARGYAHSVECWREDQLVGGLYGVALGAAFFGESMFSEERDASKVALTHLVGRLIAGGYVLLDAQFQTAHLAQFGALEISRAEFRKRLAEALALRADFSRMPANPSPDQLLQSIAQTS